LRAYYDDVGTAHIVLVSDRGVIKPTVSRSHSGDDRVSKALGGIGQRLVAVHKALANAVIHGDGMNADNRERINQVETLGVFGKHRREHA
jgi:hypothetical protein